MPNFYDFDNRGKFVNEDNITKPYKVHSYYQLLILSGLYAEHEKMLKDKNYKTYWSAVRIWKEDLRYGTGIGEGEVRDFINNVKNYSLWIKQYL